MSKLLSIVYMLFCVGLALAFDRVFEFLRMQFTRNFQLISMLAGGIFLNLIFVAALFLLAWLALFRLEKDSLVSVTFLLTGIVVVFLVPVLFAGGRTLFGVLPDFLSRTISELLVLIDVGKSYFSITGTFILGIGIANLVRKSQTPAIG
ncbi:MAG: hypothetical protein AB1649_03125 [Chloroflexota bacterium]